MSSKLIELFKDTELVTRIKNKLPYLFQLAVKGSAKIMIYKTGATFSTLSELLYSSATLHL